MPRTAQASAGRVCCHALNLGNYRCDVFLKAGDDLAFLKAIEQACIVLRMPVLACCPGSCAPVS